MDPSFFPELGQALAAFARLADAVREAITLVGWSIVTIAGCQVLRVLQEWRR